MRIAIVDRKTSFSDRWLLYCKGQGIDYKIVDPYRNDIIQQVEDCDALMWHFHQSNYKDMQMAVALLTSVSKSGKKVYPNPDTCWHFDNKVAEKYLLEAVDAPLVRSYVFFTKREAMEWAEKTSFPKVFKLKGGAGACNVKLAHTRDEAVALIQKAFGKGFLQYDWHSTFKEQLIKYKAGKVSVRDVLRPLYYATKRYPTEYAHYRQNEIGYIYFQDFIPGNKYDVRVCIVGNKAFAIRRNCRKNDFRASGSGDIVYDVNQIDTRCVEIAFDLNKKLKCQSVGFDFVFDADENPLIIECSYGFTAKGYDACEGYWTADMKWHAGCGFDFCGWMVEDLISELHHE